MEEKDKVFFRNPDNFFLLQKKFRQCGNKMIEERIYAKKDHFLGINEIFIDYCGECKQYNRIHQRRFCACIYNDYVYWTHKILCMA